MLGRRAPHRNGVNEQESSIKGLTGKLPDRSGARNRISYTAEGKDKLLSIRSLLTVVEGAGLLIDEGV